MWATQSLEIALPIIFDGKNRLMQMVEISPSPRFYAFQARLANDAVQAYVFLQPEIALPATSPATIYYDGIIVLVGQWPVTVAPVFDDSFARNGTWAGRSFTNLVRNGSAEAAGPRISPAAEAVFKHLAKAHISPSVLLTSLLDIELSGPIYQASVHNVFETFWAKFGWAHVVLPVLWYRAIGIMVIMGLLGWLIPSSIKTSLPSPLKAAGVFLLVASLFVWSITLARGVFSITEPRIYIPVARYAYPVIIPTMTFLTSGWYLLGKRFVSSFMSLVFWLGFLGVLVGTSIIHIYYFYIGRI